MNRYPAPTFRPAFGIAAAALSAVTLSVAVFLPLTFACACPDGRTLATSPTAVEVAIVPARLDVVATPVRMVRLDTVNIVARRGWQST